MEYNVTLTEGVTAKCVVCGKRSACRSAALIRVRYGDILLPKRPAARRLIPKLDLAQTNYLRELVELTPETSSKVAVEKRSSPVESQSDPPGGETSQPDQR